MKNSKVTIELIDRGNQTELILTHELPKDQVEPHQQGWANCLDHLESFLGRTTTQKENSNEKATQRIQKT